MPLFKLRRWPQFPAAVSRAIWFLFALLLAISGLQATFHAIAAGYVPVLIAIVLIVASVGILLRRRWGYDIGLAYLVLSIAVIPLRPLLRGNDGLLRSLASGMYYIGQLPLVNVATAVARYFNWWGLPLGIGSAAFLIAILALVLAAQRQLASPPAEQSSHDFARQRATLKRIAVACGLIILLPIVGVFIVAFDDLSQGTGSSPGGFGGGYHTLYAAIAASPVVLAGAIGLAITLVMRRRLKENSPAHPPV